MVLAVGAGMSPMTEDRRQAVVVLGMHRSGTSAVAGAVARLGLSSPRTPLPTTDDNPRGFYESVPVVIANHHILQATGCAWDVCLNLDPAGLEEVLSPADRHFISTILQHEFSGTTSFVMKDPRLCLTLPAWLPALHASSEEVCALIVLRHPADVVRSLTVRNGLPETEAAPHWLHYMLEAERASRGLNRAFVSYDGLMDDWRSCMRQAARVAGIAWPRPIEAAGRDVDEFLAPPLRHQTTAPATALVGPAPVRDMINKAWMAFMVLASEPEAPVALSRIDSIRARFAAWRRANFPARSQAAIPAPDTAGRRAVEPAVVDLVHQIMGIESIP